MPAIKIRREEMEIVKQAASRVERRSNSRFVIDQNKVEITDDEARPATEAEEDDPESHVICD
jgi:ribosomal 50S subunit-recycling heat shock protein